MKYSKDDPKWVQADSVEKADASGYVNVTVYGETFKMCAVWWSDPDIDPCKSDVLVQHSKHGWLRAWFYDSDISA